MAELLMRLVSHSIPSDPARDGRCYKRGDFVIARPDGWAWGRREAPPNFGIIKIPGVSVESVKPYELAWREPEQVEVEIDAADYEAGILDPSMTIVSVLGEVERTYQDGTATLKRCLALVPRTYKRCAWCLDVDALDVALQAKLEDSHLLVGRRMQPRGSEPADDCAWDTLAARLTSKKTGTSELDAGVTDAVLRSR